MDFAMKTLYTTLLAVIATSALFAVLSFVAYVEQAELNKIQANQGWCSVNMGKSIATVECSRVSKL